MTIIEAINKIDAIKPNTYSQADKVAWLSKLDWKVKTEIIDTHEGNESVSFSGYDENTSLDKKLLVPDAFDEVYITWLEAMIDYYNGEISKYNNSIVLYNTAYSSFAGWYNRNNMPIGKKFKFF